MGNIGSFWSASDWVNAREAWMASGQWNHRRVTFKQFCGYNVSGNASKPDEMIRTVKYSTRLEHVWLSQVKVFDTVKEGYFTTGDLDVISEFQIRGYSPSYTLPDGTVILEYAGDILLWNGKAWAVADQVEPVQFGFLAAQVWWRTVLRRTDRSGLGTSVGP